jgi:hypothetical protein
LKKLILLIVIFTIIASVAVFAGTSEFYVKTMSIVRVYDHNLGYKLVYVKSNFELAALYIPKDWFQVFAQTEEEPKAELVSGKESAYPYFSIFWKNGEFHHIRLYLHDDLNNDSWGDLDPNLDLTENFNIESLTLVL